MKTVKLLTKEGAYAASVEVAKMDPMPEGIQWGARIFFKQKDESYREGLLVFVPQGNAFFEKER